MPLSLQHAVILLALFSSQIHALAETETETGKKTLACFADHLDTKTPVEVKTIPGITPDKIATAQWPLGHPTIAINNSAYVKLSENAKQFVFYHECAHLQLQNKDEHDVDCAAINLLVENQNYAEIDVRRLFKSLSQAFGWQKRWSNLLDCRKF